MATIVMALTGPFSTGMAAATNLVRALQRVRGWRDQRRRALDLAALDDRMLMDIGLHRSEIASIARLPHDPTRHHR